MFGISLWLKLTFKLYAFLFFLYMGRESFIVIESGLWPGIFLPFVSIQVKFLISDEVSTYIVLSLWQRADASTNWKEFTSLDGRKWVILLLVLKSHLIWNFWSCLTLYFYAAGIIITKSPKNQNGEFLRSWRFLPMSTNFAKRVTFFFFPAFLICSPVILPFKSSWYEKK